MRPRFGPISAQRGIAFITSLLAVVLLMALIGVMVDVGTSRLRRTTEDLRSLQALAAADAGAAWIRALLQQHYGDISGVLADLAKAHSMQSLSIDSSTTANVLVSLQLPGATTHADHLDVYLQANPQIAETPLQVVATASVVSGAQIVATRTVTTLLRSFHHAAPYSEIVGVIDDAGPSSLDSPGDPAGQIGAAYATDLRIQAYSESGSGPPVPANHFQDDEWSDGNVGAPGFLP